MIMITGKSKRASTIFALLTLLFVGVIALHFAFKFLTSVGILDVPAPNTPDARFRDNTMLALLIVSASILGALYWRFEKSLPSLLMNEKGLMFPFLPGTRAGRLILWDDCVVADLVDSPADGRLTKTGFGSAHMLFENPTLLLIMLNKNRNEIWNGNSLLGALYAMNDAVAIFKKNERAIAECITIGNTSPRALLNTMNFMIQDQDARNEFCGSNATFEICDAGPNSVKLKNIESQSFHTLDFVGQISARSVSASA